MNKPLAENRIDGEILHRAVFQQSAVGIAQIASKTGQENSSPGMRSSFRRISRQARTPCSSFCPRKSGTLPGRSAKDVIMERGMLADEFNDKTKPFMSTKLLVTVRKILDRK